jgi:hypothetical protein
VGQVVDWLREYIDRAEVYVDELQFNIRLANLALQRLDRLKIEIPEESLNDLETALAGRDNTQIIRSIARLEQSIVDEVNKRLAKQ